jgi:hypothetical protein
VTNRNDSERMRELGRASGRARRERAEKRKQRGFLDVLRGRVEESPEQLVDSLLSTGAGAVVAARVLEKAGLLSPESEPAPTTEQPHAGGTTLADLFAFSVAVGLEDALGIGPLTDSQRAQARARNAELEAERMPERMKALGGEGAPETRRSPVPGQDPDRISSAVPTEPTPEEKPRAWDAQMLRLYDAERRELGLPPDPVSHGEDDDGPPIRLAPLGPDDFDRLHEARDRRLEDEGEVPADVSEYL